MKDCILINYPGWQEANVEAAVSKLSSEGLKNVQGTVCHVGKKEDRDKLLKETVARFGGLDILVSNAAVNPYFGKLIQILSRVSVIYF